MRTGFRLELSERRVTTPRLQLVPAGVASLEAELRHERAALAELELAPLTA